MRRLRTSASGRGGACFDPQIGVASLERELVVVSTRTARGLLVAGLLLGLGTSVTVATALAATSTKGGAESEQRSVKEGGTASIGVAAYDFIDPALTPSPNSSVSQN